MNAPLRRPPGFDAFNEGPAAQSLFPIALMTSAGTRYGAAAVARMIG